MEHYVEVLSSEGQVLCEPRTLEQCRASELPHRAVHVWLCVPRSGALLLRKWSRQGVKHPGASANAREAGLGLRPLGSELPHGDPLLWLWGRPRCGGAELRFDVDIFER